MQFLKKTYICLEHICVCCFNMCYLSFYVKPLLREGKQTENEKIEKVIFRFPSILLEYEFLLLIKTKIIRRGLKGDPNPPTSDSL